MIPFGLSLSKPLPWKEVKPFDKLRANGCFYTEPPTAS